nr:PEP-CTERM sorting domain-containing protein [Nitrosospira sp.]
NSIGLPEIGVVSDPNLVPEPGTLVLFGLGLLAGVVARHRRTA